MATSVTLLPGEHQVEILISEATVELANPGEVATLQQNTIEVVTVGIIGPRGTDGEDGTDGIDGDGAKISEAPAGAKNGVNITYTLSQVPGGTATDATRVDLYFNGLQVLPGRDFTRNGATLTLVTFVLQSDDDLWAIYLV